jgi:hypothetical protein
MSEKVAEVVRQAFSREADETILDYVIAVLDDEHFDYGDDGEGAYESFGEILVCVNQLSSPSSSRLPPALSTLWLIDSDAAVALADKLGMLRRR